MTFLLDNMVSPEMAVILRALDVDVKHLRDEFEPSADDTDWIPVVGERGWVLVTADKHIRTRPAERLALRQNSVTAFFLPRQVANRQRWEQAEWFLKHWRRIETEANRATVGDNFRVRDGGAIEPMG